MEERRRGTNNKRMGTDNENMINKKYHKEECWEHIIMEGGKLVEWK